MTSVWIILPKQWAIILFNEFSEKSTKILYIKIKVIITYY